MYRDIYNEDKRKYKLCIENLTSELKKQKEESDVGETKSKRLQRTNSKLNSEKKSLMSKLVNFNL